jgi:RND family efflux transporter MFP subunit
MSDIAALSRRAGRATTPVPLPPSRWKTRFLLPAVLIVALLALLLIGARDWLFPPLPVKVVPVVVRPLTGTRAESGVTIQSPGWVEADPFAVQVGALTDGVIKDILVLEGSRVTAGEVVARMIPDDAEIDLQKAQAELHQRQGELQTAEARLVAAQKNWDNPVERKRAVAAGEAMLAESKAALDQLTQEVAAEQARSESLVQEYTRVQGTAASGASTSLELIKAKQAMDAQIAVLEAARAQRPVLEAKVRQNEADLAAARENLRLRIDDERELAQAKAGVELARAMVAAAESQQKQAALKLDRMQIRTPVSGVVMARLKEPGDALMFNANMAQPTQVLKIYDPEHLQVRADVPIADAARIGVGMKAMIVVGVLPEQEFTGEVTRIVHEADLQKNTLQVKVRIDKPVPALKPEMLARVKFFANDAATSQPSAGEAVFAPETLIAANGSTHTAWVLERREGATGVAQRRAVTPGPRRLNGWIEITDGLHPGDLLIASDSDKLSEGKRVRVAGESNTP